MSGRIAVEVSGVNHVTTEYLAIASIKWAESILYMLAKSYELTRVIVAKGCFKLLFCSRIIPIRTSTIRPAIFAPA